MISGAPPFRAVVFDYDGVLVESVEIKAQAFLELFREHPEQHEAIARHHQDHLGISRFEKFAWIYGRLLGRRLEPEESAELGRRYSEIVFARTRDCAAVPGAGRTLERLAGSGVPLYVASGTPELELRALVEARGWSSRFRGVFGSPRPKPEILGHVMRTLGAEPAEIVMVGDGRSDYRAARETGVLFVWRETAAQASRFAGYAGPRVADMVELPELLGLEDGLGDGEGSRSE